MRYAVLFAALAVVGCADATAPTQVMSRTPAGAASFDQGSNVHVHSNTHQTLALDVFACNGEEVTGTDDEIMQTNVEQNADGHIHTILHVHDTMKGVGTVTGARYNGNSEFHLDISELKNTDTHIQLEFVLVGQGKVPDLHVRIDDDVRTDANGDVTKSRSVFTTTCPDAPPPSMH